MDCDKLYIHSVAPRTSAKNAMERDLQTLQINQNEILKKCSNDPWEDRKSEQTNKKPQREETVNEN